MQHHAEMAEATLGSERTAFRVAKESLKSDLDQALAAKDAMEACVQQIIDQCQRETNVFKFKKYKDGYKDRKRGSIPPSSRAKAWDVRQIMVPRPWRREPLRMLRLVVLTPSAMVLPSGAPTAEMEASPIIPASGVAPLTTGSPQVLPPSGPRPVMPPKALIVCLHPLEASRKGKVCLRDFFFLIIRSNVIFLTQIHSYI